MFENLFTTTTTPTPVKSKTKNKNLFDDLFSEQNTETQTPIQQPIPVKEVKNQTKTTPLLETVKTKTSDLLTGAKKAAKGVGDFFGKEIQKIEDVITSKPKAQPMRFEVGAGLPTTQKKVAQEVVRKPAPTVLLETQTPYQKIVTYNEKKSAEKSKKVKGYFDALEEGSLTKKKQNLSKEQELAYEEGRGEINNTLIDIGFSIGELENLPQKEFTAFGKQMLKNIKNSKPIKTLSEDIAKTTDEKLILSSLKNIFTSPDEELKPLAVALKDINKKEDVETIIEGLLKRSPKKAPTAITPAEEVVTGEKEVFKDLFAEKKAVDGLPVKTKTDDLIQEASAKLPDGTPKYKSVEEFVKAQGKTVYRGGKKLDVSKINEEGLPVTYDKKVADKFARIKNQFAESPAGQVMGYQKGQNIVENYQLIPNARIATRSDIPDNIFNAYKQANPLTKPEIAEPIITKWAKENGFDAIDFRTLGKTSAKEAEIKILNPDIIKTKSQLTDIWNKANEVKISGQSFDEAAGGIKPMADGLPMNKTKMNASEILPTPKVQTQPEGLIKTISTAPTPIMPDESVVEKLRKKLKIERPKINETDLAKEALMIKETTATGIKLQGELSEAVAKVENLKDLENTNILNKDVFKGIKNNPAYKKEGTIKDSLGEGYLLSKTYPVKGKEPITRYIVADKEFSDKLIKKGWNKTAEIDSLANEAGFERGVDYLENQLKFEVLSSAKKDIRRIVAELKQPEKIQILQEKLNEARSLIKSERRKADFVKSIIEYFNLGGKDLKKISRKDIRLMDDLEFEKYLTDLESKATQLVKTRQAKNELLTLINERHFAKWDNLRNAMKLPTIENMSDKQLKEFTEALIPYQYGDEFLTTRKLETVNNTELAGIKTIREAREKLAEKLRIEPKDLENIKVEALDRFRWDTSLAEKNPFYKMLVEDTAKSFLNEEVLYVEFKNELEKLGKKALKSRKRTIGEKLIPQQKLLREYLEAPLKRTKAGQLVKEDIAYKMTPEEIDLASFIQSKYEEAFSYLLKVNSLRGSRFNNQNYFTHLRRGILESVKEDGLITGVKELFTKYKDDQAIFNILEGKTDQILPLEKFFKFSVFRSGNLQPTENVLKAVDSYFQVFHRKKALDYILPSMDIYAHALTPSKLTQRGLEMDASLKNFVKEWLNNKKGRRTDFLKIPQGSTPDLALRAVRTFTSIMDLGLNIGVGAVTYIGENVTTYALLGKKAYAKGLARLLTKKGRAILKDNEAFIGRSAWKSLTDPTIDVGEKLMKGLFIQFNDAAVKANKIFLLGSLTKEEWQAGKISAERLASMRTTLGRLRVVEGAKSIIGSTSAGGMITQYKTWAVPIFRTLSQDLISLGKKIVGKGQITKQQVTELYSMLEIGAVGLLTGVYVIDNAKDDSLVGQLKKRVYNEFMTLYGALDPKTLTTVPRAVKLIEDLGKNISMIIKLEKYKTKPGLKGVEGLKKQFTPKAIRQFAPVEETTQQPEDLLKAKSEVTKEKTKAKDEFKPRYEEIQDLISKDKLDEAKQIVDSLTDEEYEIYKSLRASDKRAETNKMKIQVWPKYKKIKELEKAGKIEEALSELDLLTDEEYKAYKSLAKSLED